MTFSTDMYEVGLELLTELGEPITFVRDLVGSYSPMTGEVTDLSNNTPYTGYGHPSNYTLSQIDGTIIQQNDILLILSSADTPIVNDIFTVGSVAYTALSVQKIRAQGMNIIYKVQLRQ